MKNFLVLSLLFLLVLGACTFEEAGIVEEFEEVEGVDGMNPVIVFETSKGTFKAELFEDKAPVTVENFLKYVDDNYFDGLVFHRVIDGFMVQGGGFTPEGNQRDTRDPIALESDTGLKNNRGTLAMARTDVPDSATSQFFVNLVDNDFLNRGARDEGYAVFGEVIEGMDVVDEIAKVSTTTKHGMQDWPVDDIIIKRAYRQ